VPRWSASHGPVTPAASYFTSSTDGGGDLVHTGGRGPVSMTHPPDRRAPGLSADPRHRRSAARSV